MTAEGIALVAREVQGQLVQWLEVRSQYVLCEGQESETGDAGPELRPYQT
jgi:hypothetical protein